MNVLMLSDVYFPRINGVSTSIRTFCHELAALGHAVTIVAPDYQAAAQAPPEFEVIRLPSRPLAFDPEDRLIKSAALPGAVAVLAKRHWDVIHIRTPFRAHQLGCDLPAPPVGRPSRAITPTSRSMSPAICRGCRGHSVASAFAGSRDASAPMSIICWCRRGRWPTCLTTTASRPRRPSTVVGTGVRLEEFRGGDRARFRQQQGFADDTRGLLTVRRLAIEKNVDLLLEVMQVLAVDFPALVFVIAGEGPDAQRLRGIVEQSGLGRNVRFPGNLDRSGGRLDCYRGADLFVFASNTETQGLVLIEAMAMSLPIVSTALMGAATVLAGAASARISAEAVAPFAAHVAALLRAPRECARLAAAGSADAQPGARRR